ncbi:MAG: ATP phosphoribosyltransferase regulatory subunit, partial [Alphaproteobacteria bacterium]|nr:ATP phosphoribosyltransferase regulatory subunit [Alphaproteobacteria bacterium]
DEGTSSEPATGFTLYMDTVLGAATVEPPSKRLYVPVNVAWAELARWRGEGFHTVHGLGPVEDVRAEAVRLACAYALINGEAVVL